ncbi:GNAT family N-acetyltransferase [Stenotrophomonas rhizophila]|uniref:GNAT family N-acetyltransferase n=1 Tax=Stenotrophomonas rhizophila TaxID=216778 RepID=UPI001E2D360A|nr:GNAT family protein [Stenotrophomonas rhizophila]MCC7634943.1 GNAT family N-acetyltransferase [Stenotrophomonas rhizophila]MCC7664274.1 GNAT family N-acetyltransferase [Stenotrophomonas rhizophila]
MDDSLIHADGLLLRPFVDADADPFAAAVRESAAGMRRWMPWCSDDYGVEQALQWFQACRTGRAGDTAYEYGVFEQDTGAFVGGAGLNEIRHDHRFCNLGYWVRQSRQGQGVATRVVHALAGQAFGPLRLQRVEIVVAVGNLASERVAVKSGALREGVARNRLVIDDRPAPAHMFSLVP